MSLCLCDGCCGSASSSRPPSVACRHKSVIINATAHTRSLARSLARLAHRDDLLAATLVISHPPSCAVFRCLCDVRLVTSHVTSRPLSRSSLACQMNTICCNFLRSSNIFSFRLLVFCGSPAPPPGDLSFWDTHISCYHLSISRGGPFTV